jgi:hypothetical protein
MSIIIKDKYSPTGGSVDNRLEGNVKQAKIGCG